MHAEIRAIRTPTALEWDTIWNECDYATYFHSRHWAEVWHEYMPAKKRPAPQLIEFLDGKKALLPITIALHGRGLIEVSESSPSGTYGGWISNDELTSTHAACLTKYLVALPNLFWMTNPYDPLVGDAVGESGEVAWTWRFDLRSGFDALHQRMNKGQIPRNYRIGVKSGLTLRPMEERFLPAVGEIYQSCQERWENPVVYRADLFSILLRTPSCDFSGVFDPADRLVAAVITFRSRRHVAGWMEFAKGDDLRLRPFEFANYHLIEKYQKEGYWWFDFNPSGNRPGVDQFKRRFGTDKVELRTIKCESTALQLAGNAHEFIRSVQQWRSRPSGARRLQKQKPAPEKEAI